MATLEERPSRTGAADGDGVPATAPQPPATAPSSPGSLNGRADVPVPIKGVGARLVARMNESLEVPTATSFRDIDAALLESERARLNAAIAPRKLSFTHVIAYALVQAVQVHPAMAAYYREIEGQPHRVAPAHLGLGLAVDVTQRDGSRFLVVPVIHGADDLDLLDFLARYDDLVDRARAGRLIADDLAGGTVTLTNPGTVGTTASMPRLLAGQGTIVATGAIRHIGGQSLMTVSSTYDHRIIQGAESGAFLRTIDEFLQGADGFYEHVAGAFGLAGPPPRTATPITPATPPSEAELAQVASAMALLRSYRSLGHRAACLDPLGTEPPGDPNLDPATWGLDDASMTRIPASALRVTGIALPGRTLAEMLPELRRTYCGNAAYEVEHISSYQERSWLRRAIESGEYMAPPSPDERRRLLDRLTSVEGFERFLQRVYIGQTRFSIEGLDVLVPMLDLLIERVAAEGAETVEIGMPHRGRLNVLAHVVGVPYSEILADFERGRPTAEAEAPAEGETSDVKYHLGAEGTYRTASGPVRVTVSPNPSHLEAIDPVVEGRARAEQTDRSGPQPRRNDACAIPVLIHGDASFAAQGIVAETFNLARLPGYATGGTVHIIGNNQLGFTVEPKDARSTDYASDLAKGFDVPIVHVNADDPEACLGAVRLALAYRDQFHADFVIDVVGYRRHGHNEGDEPAYTQPLMYDKIAAHPTVRRIYLDRLAEEGLADQGSGEEALNSAQAELSKIRDSVVAELASGDAGEGSAADRTGEARLAGSKATASKTTGRVSARSKSPPKPPRTAVPEDLLRAINDELIAVPDGFTLNSKLAPQMERRRAAVEDGGRIAWAQAEALALGSLLAQGVPVRLTGQDTVRGTFSQRHLAFVDARTGQRYAPIEHLSRARASIEIHDSPLSEASCMGFEYGYAVEAPEALVVWEAQYGDFANGAEIVIDQFLIAGLAKWGQTSRLTLLLPHGYEGQGPEHSSARLERYLALGAEGNIRVANPTTPAQYFHVLRDQALREPMRPLVLMTPKGLLRLPSASSTLTELTAGGFQPVLVDPERSKVPDQVRRLVLCSGRVYYDLTGSPRWGSSEAAVARVELLYPFPTDEIAALVRRYPNLETVVWAQEEPRNMGARKFLMPELRAIVPERMPILEVSRPERSSPAEGYHAAHRAEQARIVREAMGE